MKIEIYDNEVLVAKQAASIIADEARRAIALRGRFTFAVSGGRTPWIMLHALAEEDIPWELVHFFQVDERIAPDGDPDRNLTYLQESLLAVSSLLTGRIHAMPVGEKDPEEGAAKYAATLREIAGTPPVIDLVHLGFGSDGHTASLVPGDPVLDVHNRDVAVTGIYMNRRRMTLTYPIINRARKILWVATGRGKSAMLQRLINQDQIIPAGRVEQRNASIITDTAAENIQNV